MATFAAVFAPQPGTGGVENVTKVSALANGASSSEIALGANNNYKVLIVGFATPGQSPNGYFNVKFGPAGLTAATASDLGIPLNTPVTFDMGSQFASLRFFNNSSVAGTMDIYVLPLSQI